MLPNPYTLERLVVERREEMLRAAEEARLARQARPSMPLATRPGPRVWLAEALRGLADRLEPTWGSPAKATCEIQRP